MLSDWIHGFILEKFILNRKGGINNGTLGKHHLANYSKSVSFTAVVNFRPKSLHSPTHVLAVSYTHLDVYKRQTRCWDGIMGSTEIYETTDFGCGKYLL